VSPHRFKRTNVALERKRCDEHQAAASSFTAAHDDVPSSPSWGGGRRWGAVQRFETLVQLAKSRLRSRPPHPTLSPQGGEGRFIASIVACLTILFAPLAHAQPPRPQRIVSMNLCTDELLMRIVEPSRIAAITHLSQQPINAPLGLDAIASKLSINHGLAEEVIALKPDLILAGSFTTTTATALLRKLGYTVITFEPENSFDDMRANIRKLGAATGDEASAERVIAEFDARLATLQARIPDDTRPIFADIGVNNFITGDGTLYAHVINAAGYQTLGQALGFTGYRNVPLEQILTVRPALMSTATPWTRPPSMSTMALGHPALRAMTARTLQVEIPERYTTCGAPSVLGAVEILVNAREKQARRP
jgi:iron complex transport system substrate-binding protein